MLALGGPRLPGDDIGAQAIACASLKACCTVAPGAVAPQPTAEMVGPGQCTSGGGQQRRIGDGRRKPWHNRPRLAMSHGGGDGGPYQGHGSDGCHGSPAAPSVAKHMVGPSRPSAGDAAMNAILHLQYEDRMPSIRAGVTTVRRDSHIGLPANDNRPAVERPLAVGVDIALIVARRLLLGASCIGFIAAGAFLLGIDQPAP